VFEFFMKPDDPKTPTKPSDLAEQLTELLQLRRKVRAAEMAALTGNRRRPGDNVDGGLERSSKTPSESSRKLRR
jgi:hypothetical protein